MRRKTIKRVFLFFIIYLPIQYGLVGIVGYYQSEPWPAFVFPGFKNVFVFEGGYEIQHTRFELVDPNSDRVTELTPSEVFPDVPNSMIAGFMRAKFSDDEVIQSFDETTREWLLQRTIEMADEHGTDLHIHYAVKYLSGGPSSLEPDSIVTTNRFTIIEQ